MYKCPFCNSEETEHYHPEMTFEVYASMDDKEPNYLLPAALPKYICKHCGQVTQADPEITEKFQINK